MNAKKVLAIVSIVMSIAVFNCHAEGLRTLIEAGKSQAEMQKKYDEETDTYKGIKREFDNGAISKGEPKEAIMRKYGEPVVVIGGSRGKREKWIYKPASSSYFKGPRLDLFFGENGLLEDIVAGQ